MLQQYSAERGEHEAEAGEERADRNGDRDHLEPDGDARQLGKQSHQHPHDAVEDNESHHLIKKDHAIRGSES